MEEQGKEGGWLELLSKTVHVSTGQKLTWRQHNSTVMDRSAKSKCNDVVVRYASKSNMFHLLFLRGYSVELSSSHYPFSCG